MPQSTVLYLRLFSHGLTAINFGVIAFTLVVFLKRSDVGHRTLLRMITIFCVLVHGDALYGIWQSIYPNPQAYALMRLGTAMYGSICVTYFVITNRDLLKTFRISELWDRLRKDKLAEREQARQQMIFLSEQTLAQSEGILARSKG